jgi:phasin family protein
MNNVFQDIFKNFSNGDNMCGYNNPFFNFDAPNYNELMQKNLDAMMKAGQVSMENGQAIARRVAEIMQKQVGEIVEASRDIMSSQNPENALQKQQNFIKAATNNAIADSKEVVEMTSKSVMEVYDIFSKRATENASAAQNTVKKAGK